MSSPIIGVLRYTSTETFDRIVLLYDRHHANVFHAAGFKNLYWFPGLTFPHEDSVVRAARPARPRVPRIAFVGQAGKHHPRRLRMLDAVAGRQLPLVQKAANQADALSFYGSSVLGLNCSLNGDLNLRVFEILSSGAALLTDRLAPDAGLDHLFNDGVQLLSYGSREELVERAAYALAHPAETKAIGTAGARWFDQHFGAARRREAFQRLAFDGTPVPEFALSPPEPQRVLFAGDTDRLLDAVMVYEGVQEIHRTRETVQVSVDSTVPPDVLELYATLPRISVGPSSPEVAADLGIFGRASAAPMAQCIWCWDAGVDDTAALAVKLRPLGYVQSNPVVAIFNRTAAVSKRSGEEPFEAPLQKSAEEPAPQAEISPAVGSTRLDGTLLLGRVALKARDYQLAREVLGAARKINAVHPRVAAFEQELTAAIRP
jgi:hypothetical protein